MIKSGKTKAKAKAKIAKVKKVPLYFKGKCCKKLCSKNGNIKALNCYANNKDHFCTDLIREKQGR